MFLQMNSFVAVSQRANIAYIDDDGNVDRRNVNVSRLVMMIMIMIMMMMMMMIMMMVMMMMPRLDCHMLYKDGSVLAAVSHCISGQLMGFISTHTDTFEISPLTPRLRSVMADTGGQELLRAGDSQSK